MLEHDETRVLRSVNTGSSSGDDRSGVLARNFVGASRSTLVIEAPVIGVVVPEHVGQAEDFFGNGTNTVVDVALRRSPELGNVSAAVIGEDLHGPAELSNELLIGESSAELVGSSVNSKVLIALAYSVLKLLLVGEDIGANHEVGGRLVILVEEAVEIVTVASWAIVETDSHVVGRSIDDVILAETFGDGPRASLGIETGVVGVDRAATLVHGRGDVGNLACSDSSIKGTEPLLRRLGSSGDSKAWRIVVGLSRLDLDREVTGKGAASQGSKKKQSQHVGTGVI